jgi:hypothetical protein
MAYTWRILQPMDTIATHTAAPVKARAHTTSVVTIGGWGDIEILVTINVPKQVFCMIDAPEEWVGTLSACKTVTVGNISTSYWMNTYSTKDNDMEVLS